MGSAASRARSVSYDSAHRLDGALVLVAITIAGDAEELLEVEASRAVAAGARRSSARAAGSRYRSSA
jgi:hypothetical protein